MHLLLIDKDIDVLIYFNILKKLNSMMEIKRTMGCVKPKTSHHPFHMLVICLELREKEVSRGLFEGRGTMMATKK